MMTEVARTTGVSGRLLVRLEAPATWMEVYEDVADPVGFAREFAVAALRHELARFAVDGIRHVEAFVAAD